MLSISSETLLCISLFGAICTYIPLMSHSSPSYEYEPLEDSSRAKIFLDALVAAMAVAVPMLMDAIMDHNLSRRVILPRFMLLLSQLGPNLIMYVHGITNVHITYFLCSIHAREVLFIGSLMSYFVGLGGSLPRIRAAVIFTALFAISINLHNASYFISSPVILSLSLIISAISLIGIIVLCLYFFRQWRQRPDAHERFSIIYVACLIFDLLAKWIIFAATGMKGWDDRSGVYFACLTIVDAAVAIAASTLPGRMARDEAAYAKHILETKRNFVRYISHEIRTPLNTVYMGIQLAKNNITEIPAATNLSDIMADIQDSCSISIEILNDLLLFDKFEHGNVELSRRVVGVRDLITNTVKPFVVQARQAEIEFTYMGDEYFAHDLDEACIDVDINKISQVIRNFVSNALKFTPRGGRVDVVIRRLYPDVDMKKPSRQRLNRVATMPQEFVRVEVRDTGCGISLENQVRVFREIIQFDTTYFVNGKGSGLGLWISKAIVDLHGGKIGVESSGIPGEGSMFYFQLPVCHQQAANNSISFDPGSLSISQASLTATTFGTENSLTVKSGGPEISAVWKTSRVLIVDDSNFNRKMMRKVLETYYGEVAEASDGMEAVQMVEDAMRRGANYDAIFMDSVMPRMGGIEATTIIRQIEYTGLIVGVTGNALPEDIVEFINSGANRVLTKPLQLQHVTAVLTDFAPVSSSALPPLTIVPSISGEE